jgi:hypothetical protein
VEWAFHAIYPLLGAVSGGKVCKGKERFFSPMGKNCDIGFPAKWKVFSIRAIRLVPYAGQIMTNSLGLNGSTFGCPIARVRCIGLE